MQKRYHALFLTSLLLLLVLSIGGCKRASPTEVPSISITTSVEPVGEGTPRPGASQAYPQPTSGEYPFATIPIEITATVSSSPQPSEEGGYPAPQPSVIGGTAYPGFVTATPYPAPYGTPTVRTTQEPEATQSQVPRTATPTETEVEPSSTSEQEGSPTGTEAYPAPQFSPTGPYPGPELTETRSPYLGPETSTPLPTGIPSITATPTALASGTVFPSPTAGEETTTPISTPVEIPPRPPLSPPPPGSTVTIWHSWGITETEMLQSIIEAFQRAYPDVTFRLRFIPQDDLYDAFYEAAYLGQGSSLLLGPAKWGPDLFEGQLIDDLDPYVSPDFTNDINPAALASGQYHKSLISLPLSQEGMVMFRNTSIIASAPQTFEELTRLSLEATHAGIVGSYLERGAFFSAADIIGLGGRLMDDDGNPQFDNEYGITWFKLLSDYDKAGAVTFNTNRDLEMFKRGRVGLIIDGSWSIASLTQIIGKDNLAINPWPTYGAGYMSGWVEAESVFLNANISENDRFAALAFIGYLLDPQVQVRLAEVGHIPSVLTASPRDRLIQQAMQAFSSGVPYPTMIDDNVLQIYWQALDKAIQNVYLNGITPQEALKSASEAINAALVMLEARP